MSQEPLKNLVHRALIEADLLTSPLSHVFAQLGPDLDTGTLPTVVSTSPKWSTNVSLCVSGTSKKFGTCKHNEKWTQLNFRGAHTWSPKGLWASTWPPGGHVPAHRGTHFGWGQTSKLLIESHGPNLFRDTTSPSLMLYLAGIQSTVNANGEQDECFTA